MSGHLTKRQVDYLLRPISPIRVKFVDGQSYLPQQDVRAHLTRVFGFGGWSSTVTDSSMISEDFVSWMKNGQQKQGYDAVWRARVRLTIRDPDGQQVAEYEDEATGDATHQPTKAAAHDLALKSAVSTALKRAATSLGDQFGLSLYNKGSQDAFVIFTLAYPSTPDAPAEQATVPAEVPAATEEEPTEGDGAEHSPTGEVVDVDGVRDPAPPAERRQVPADIPAEQHRENARAYANQQHAQRHAERAPEPAEPEPEPPTLEEVLAKAQADQNWRNGNRSGPAINQAKARCMDAVRHARPSLAWNECLQVIKDSLAQNFEPDITTDTAEPWHFDTLSGLFEAEELDTIRKAYAHE